MFLRFAQGLPPGIDQMNDDIMATPFPPQMQPLEEIMEILTDAASVAAPYDAHRAGDAVPFSL